MNTDQEREGPSPWFGAQALAPASAQDPPDAQTTPNRLWQALMSARVLIAVVLLLLQVSARLLGHPVSWWLTGLCALYLVATVAVRWLGQPRDPRHSVDSQWAIIVGVDVTVFSALHFFHGSSINYTPLFALPVLLSAVLGSLMLALGTTAAVTLLLLGGAWSGALWLPTEMGSQLLQAGLTGTGLFVVALLTHQLATRLAREEEAARQSASLATLHGRVNELVIENLADGILVVDRNRTVRAANPAARAMVDWARPARRAPFSLDSEPGWQVLARLAEAAFRHGGAGDTDTELRHPGMPPCRVRVRIRMASTASRGGESLCVMFLQDQRELEARVRNEKLSAMGRMSAAVAHEIRNPLAAISQANALLDEELDDPTQKRLTDMVRQNAQRLAQIVDEILNIAGVKQLAQDPTGNRLALAPAVQSMCKDWLSQEGKHTPVSLSLSPGTPDAQFSADHLRRVIVNLLDNARRYARHAAPIHVRVDVLADGRPVLGVWSDGPALEPAVQRHLFEPFFSSESRSSGLGLYICRELCERHGATINHERSCRELDARQVEGNEFCIAFQNAGAPVSGHAPLMPT